MSQAIFLRIKMQKKTWLGEWGVSKFQNLSRYFEDKGDVFPSGLSLKLNWLVQKQWWWVTIPESFKNLTWPTYHLERSESHRWFRPINPLERSERLKGSWLTFNLEQSKTQKAFLKFSRGSFRDGYFLKGFFVAVRIFCFIIFGNVIPK